MQAKDTFFAGKDIAAEYAAKKKADAQKHLEIYEKVQEDGGMEVVAEADVRVEAPEENRTEDSGNWTNHKRYPAHVGWRSVEE